MTDLDAIVAAGGRVRIHVGDCRETLAALPEASVDCVVTSPPYYGLRDYGVDGQIGLEQTPAEYVAQLVAVFRECRRVMKPGGTLWLNLGDSYAGTGATGGGADGARRGADGFGGASPNGKGTWRSPREWGLKVKDLLGVPWRVAFALQDDGWWLRSEIIWSKPNPMPESVRDRPTKAHEQVFLLSKAERYWYDKEAVNEPASYIVTPDRRASGDYSEGSGRNDAGRHRRGGFVGSDTRNARTVWTIATEPCDLAHFALMPTELARRCILAGCPKGGTVLDPFGGGGTTGLTAARHGRRAILCELNPEYAEIARQRIAREWREPVKPSVPESAGPLFDMEVA